MRGSTPRSRSSSGSRPPAPDALEHTSVQALQKTLPRRNLAAAKGPAGCRGDVLLFEFVQFAAQRNVGRDELFAFLGRQRRCMIVAAV